MKIINKRIIIFAILLGVAAVVIIVGLLLSRNPKQHPEPITTPLVSPTIYPTRAVGQGIFEQPFPGFTGASDEDPFAGQENRPVNTAFKLRKQLPVDTDRFIITYDYSEALFEVTLKGSDASARVYFLQWLSDNNYDQIPLNEFVFTR